MVQIKAQFDDRIRNLLALAEDNSVESRTLLFSHICDLFIQKRPMESENQVKMLIDIINELAADIDIGIRKELRNILLNMDGPPEELIKLISEDVIEVSGKLLEQSFVDEEQLLYLIRYASDEHREFINHRFGLTPLLRRELEEASKLAKSSRSTTTNDNKKISLNDLEEAQQNSTILNEDATANILELLKSNKETQSTNTSHVHFEKTKEYDKEEASNSPDEPTQDDSNDSGVTDIILPSLTSKILQDDNDVEDDDHSEEDVLELVEPVSEEEIVEKDDLQPSERTFQAITKGKEEWFWEIDRYGNITYLSDDSKDIFATSTPTMIGEDFLCLWIQEDEEPDEANSFIALFEKRLPFRDRPFSIEGSDGELQKCLLSAIATFDVDTGRFTGFRGSSKHDSSSMEDLIENAQRRPFTSEAKEHDDIYQPKFSDSLNKNKLGTQDNEKISSNDDENNIDNELSEDEQEEVASELLNNLSHEFRTPLNAIIGFSQMIDNEMWGPVSEKYRKNTKDIIDAANHLKDAVNNILDSAKINAGLIEPSPASFSLKAIIQESLQSVAPILETKDISVSGVEDNIDVILYNDKYCIILCLIKMITFGTRNAESGSNLKISVLVNSNAEVRIEIPILNQDIGEEHAKNLFLKVHEPNTKDGNTTIKNKEFEGKISTGFGLTVAQDIAHLIGGELSTLSDNGKITHIVLTISTFPI